MISTVDVLKVVGAFINEDNYTVWSDMTTNLGQIGLLLQNTDGYNDFKAFNKKLFKPVAQSLGWDSKEGEGVYLNHRGGNCGITSCAFVMK
jgi:puromycin-sensitive aminopeptidase